MNAAVELAHQLLAVAALARPELGTTVTPSLVSGGTAVNTVAPPASAHVDVRTRTRDEAERLDAAFAALRPVLTGAAVAVERTLNVPPLERTSSVELFERAQRLALELGLRRSPRPRSEAAPMGA